MTEDLAEDMTYFAIFVMFGLAMQAPHHYNGFIAAGGEARRYNGLHIIVKECAATSCGTYPGERHIYISVQFTEHIVLHVQR